ncbi:hypothetical protein D3C77_282980 [compost metagenome]
MGEILLLVGLGRHGKILIDVSVVIKLLHVIHRLDITFRFEFRRDFPILTDTPDAWCAEVGAKRLKCTEDEIAAIHKACRVLYTVSIRILLCECLGHLH